MKLHIVESAITEPRPNNNRTVVMRRDAFYRSHKDINNVYDKVQQEPAPKVLLVRTLNKAPSCKKPPLGAVVMLAAERCRTLLIINR